MTALRPRPPRRCGQVPGPAAVLLALGACALRPSPGAAQAFVSPQLVTCESTRNQRHECPVPPEAEVRLVRRLDSAACVPGRTWGREGAILWVDQGCRGVFSVAQPSTRTIVTCGSTETGRQACPTLPDAEVVLLRQVGEAACVRGRTWGYEGGSIWTDGGCRAEFEVAPRVGRGPTEPVRLLCESMDRERADCPIPGAGSVLLVRQLSRAPCARGETWDVDRGRLWVAQGCRGEFEVRPKQAP